MKLKAIKIQNFQGYKDEAIIHISNLTALRKQGDAKSASQQHLILCIIEGL
ncbi:hypothetical protein KL86SPO_31176 [uncultured Sporomusa sp.]|uniref:Uncharacterized protein n=1 Tax=uncultured Sporomusa sp. TaxID=307249 RepID=A0A212LU17_9FIRM|nr:hypothetical protein [uncultured Sporomusa sp.]SCM80997.1 hypothetical protein KL86SPO_31176 [uncultured Sporomusa sp.]